MNVYNSPIATSQLTPIDMSKLKTVKLPDDATQLLEAVPAPAPSVKADNDPSNLYATIQKGGKTIATFYNSGLMVTPNGEALPGDLAFQGHGTELANARIQQMLKMYGGTVQYAQNGGARTLFDTQLAGQS